MCRCQMRWGSYHKKGERWASGEEAFLKTALDATGITAEDFAAARKTDEVVKLADSWKVSYDGRHGESPPMSSTASGSS